MAKKVYVGNLSYSTQEDTLREVFTPYGTIESVNIITDRDTGRSKGFAFVEMATEDEAKAAIAALDKKEIDGRQVQVNEARDRKDSGGRDSRGGGGFRKNRY